MNTMRATCLAAAVALTLAACSRPAINNSGEAAQAPTAAPEPTAPAPALDYVGRWTGVEGMFLDVQPGAGPGRYRLTMQYDLDHRATVDAKREGDALAFTRDGKALALRPTDGDATGLKYLAGKRDCLTVAPGEGYCRD